MRFCFENSGSGFQIGWLNIRLQSPEKSGNKRSLKPFKIFWWSIMERIICLPLWCNVLNVEEQILCFLSTKLNIVYNQRIHTFVETGKIIYRIGLNCFHELNSKRRKKYKLLSFQVRSKTLFQ